MPAFSRLLFAGALSIAATGPAAATVIAEFDFVGSSVSFGNVGSGVSNLGGNGLVGTAFTNDPQILVNGVSITPAAGQTFSTFQFRVREFDDEADAFVTTFDPTGVVVALNGGGGGLTFANSATAVDDGDNFFLVTQDISALGAGTLNSFRFDPIGGAAANSNSETDDNGFEVSFVRINVIPEPASLALLGLGGVALLGRRRS